MRVKVKVKSGKRKGKTQVIDKRELDANKNLYDFVENFVEGKDIERLEILEKKQAANQDTASKKLKKTQAELKELKAKFETKEEKIVKETK